MRKRHMMALSMGICGALIAIGTIALSNEMKEPAIMMTGAEIIESATPLPDYLPPYLNYTGDLVTFNGTVTYHERDWIEVAFSGMSIRLLFWVNVNDGSKLINGDQMFDGYNATVYGWVDDWNDYPTIIKNSIVISQQSVKQQEEMREAVFAIEP